MKKLNQPRKKYLPWC